MSQQELNPQRKDILGVPDSSRPLMSLIEIVPGIERDFKIHQGKVRDNIDLGENLLMVATDRISTFDVVHPNGIPDKGKMLTQMSLRWFDLLSKVSPHHLITANIEEFPDPFNYQPLTERTILVKKLHMVPIECVVRGYITGSAMAEYKDSGSVCGIKLPAGLVESQKLIEPIFTPATKSTIGHDENISFEEMKIIIGEHFPDLDANSIANDLKEKTLALYANASDYAIHRGIIIADTKFEFGFDENGNIILGDEVLTPDSSRFWDAGLYQTGRSQDSLDKQFVRDYVTSIGWNKKPPAPLLPAEIIQRTAQRYTEAYQRLFG